MKIGRKILSVLLSASMMLSMCAPTFAAQGDALTDSLTGKTVDVSWYGSGESVVEIKTAEELVALGAIVGGRVVGIPRDDFKGKTVKLTADINMENTLFYPIGYAGPDLISFDADFKAFRGTFDGNNKAISNITQNAEVMADAMGKETYRDGMGLFGYILGGTVENLIIENFKAEGKYADMGAVAAYAEGTCTFKDIVLTGSSLTTEGCAAAGIVGWDSGRSSVVTFENIDIDGTNTFAVGSKNSTVGGVMGYLNKNSAATFAGCDVASTLKAKDGAGDIKF